jgi:hypothetical protein
MLLICIRSYLKSILRYKFLILDTYYPDTLNIREQGCENPRLFFEARRGPRAEKFGKHCFRPLLQFILSRPLLPTPVSRFSVEVSNSF